VICAWVARVSCNKATCEPSSRMTTAVSTATSSRRARDVGQDSLDMASEKVEIGIGQL
jgi:hypothetical protein